MGWPKDPNRLAMARARQSLSQSVSVEVRLWARTIKTETCWLWQGAKWKSGYGAITDRVQGKVWRTHQLAWVLTNGPIPKGLCILHRCDIPACVNPSHLFIGTHADNVKDRVSKGRSATGDRCSLSRPDIRYSNKGIPMSKDQKQKLSFARKNKKGHPHTDETKAKLKKAWERRKQQAVGA